MVERQDFEHQKLVTQEAYLFGLTNRIDFDFKGIVEDFADLPLVGNATNDAYYVRNGISNWVYIWNGAAWAKDTAGGSSGGVNYTSFPTTTGNKLTKSIGLNADFIQETGIDVDASNNVTGMNTLTTVGDITAGGDLNGTDVNVTNVNATTVNATTGNITTVNSTDVNTTNINATNIDVDNITIVNPPSGGGAVNDITTETTATYNATIADDVILADGASNAITVNLYTAVGNNKRKLTIKKIDSTANVITIDPSGAQTIDGQSTYTLNTQYSVITIISNGANWFII